MNTDPIADFLTRIRNAIKARHEKVNIPFSKMKEDITKLLLREKYIKEYEIKEIKVKGTKSDKKSLEITFIPFREMHLKRVSKPGQRIYIRSSDIKPVKRGFGISIISTNKGVITGRDAKNLSVGGEILCEIF